MKKLFIKYFCFMVGNFTHCGILNNVRFNEKVDYYQILEVQASAGMEEINLAYEKCKQTFSLGNIDLYSVFSPSEAKAWIALIEEAYQVLSNQNAKHEYDSFRSNLPVNIQPPQLDVDISEENQFNLHQEDPLWADTPLSRYEISEEIENEIAQRTDFDGLFLKKVRVYKNVSVQDFSRRTCIGARHINAIENNNFSVLPAAVFVRGYIVQYCKILGLDQAAVVTSFMNHLSNEQRPLA